MQSMAMTTCSVQNGEARRRMNGGGIRKNSCDLDSITFSWVWTEEQSVVGANLGRVGSFDRLWAEDYLWLHRLVVDVRSKTLRGSKALQNSARHTTLGTGADTVLWMYHRKNADLLFSLSPAVSQDLPSLPQQECLKLVLKDNYLFLMMEWDDLRNNIVISSQKLLSTVLANALVNQQLEHKI